MRRDFEVSVPSRGNGVIDLMVLCVFLLLSMKFPSPLGEMGLSIHEYIRSLIYFLNCEFPSPLGEMGLSIGLSAAWPYSRRVEFPSPLGEMGLSITKDISKHVRQSIQSFRPLSGKWGYRSTLVPAVWSLRLPSFRPLSGKWGYRFDCLCRQPLHDCGKFPSPLGEMGLSIALTMRSRRDNSRIHSMYQYLTHAFSILK